MKRISRLLLWVLGIVVVLAVATPFLTTSLHNKPEGDKAAGRGRGHHHGGGDGAPTPVLTAKSREADVPVFVEGVGTGQALNSVLIRSQVDGTLESLKFTEGQVVKAGDTIATIDPRLYKATLDQDIAKKQLDEAMLANNKRDLERYKQLVSTKAVTQQQYDTQVATVAQTEAQIAIDQATIDSARTTLSYTDVVTPITGRTGIRKVDVGNLIHASDTTGIVTVSQIQPISVIFNVPQQELGRINKASLLGQLDVRALDGSGKEVIDRGVLAVVDNTIDQTTGTVKLKAIFDNKDLQLWPGIFANVRLKVETLKDAVIIPVGALQRGPKGPFVFTVVPGGAKKGGAKADTAKQDGASKDGETTDDAAKDGTAQDGARKGGAGKVVAKMVPITVGQQDDEQAVVTSGLAAGETLITSGFAKLTDGAAVTPSEDVAEAAKEKAPAGLHQGGVSPPPSAGNAAASDVPGRRGRNRRNGAGE